MLVSFMLLKKESVCNDYVISVMIISVIAFTIKWLVFENRSSVNKTIK